MFKRGDIVKFKGLVNANFGPEDINSLGEVTAETKDGAPTFYLVKWRDCLARQRGTNDA